MRMLARGVLAGVLAVTTARGQTPVTVEPGAREAYGVGVVKVMTRAGHEQSFAGVLVGEDRVLTIGEVLDSAVSAAFKPPCCDARGVIGVVRADVPHHLVLLQLEPSPGTVARPVGLAPEIPGAGTTISMTIAAVEGEGVLSGTGVRVLSVEEWPIEGRLLRVKFPLDTFKGGGVALDGERRLIGFAIGGAGNDCCLVVPVEPAAIAPGEAVSLDRFAARERTAIERALGLLQHSENGDLASAETSLRRALELEPRLWRARWRLGVVLDESGRREEALDELGKAYALTPWFCEVPYSVGLVTFKLGRFAEAVEWFDRALAIDDEYPSVHAMRGVALHSLERNDEAIAAGRRAVSLRPTDPSFTGNLALFLQSAGRTGEAAAAWRELCTQSPKDAQAWIELARWLRKDGRDADAVGAIREGIDHSPESSSLQVALAVELVRAGDREGALTALRRALELEPDRKDGARLRRLIESLESEKD